MTRKQIVCVAALAANPGMFNTLPDQSMTSPRFLLISLLALATNLANAATDWTEKSALAALKVTAQSKAEACQALAVIGGPKSVPVLAGLLDDRQLAAYARTALEVIDHPSAGIALLEALPNLEGQLLIGVVTSIGARGDKEAVPQLQELVADPKRGAAEAALVALARIGGGQSFTTIVTTMNEGPEELRIPAAHAVLLAADVLAKRGNTKGAERMLKNIQTADLPEHIKRAANL
jgi:HEAT repeat protein